MRRSAIVLVAVLVPVMLALAGCDAIIKSGVEKATGVKVEGDQVTITKDGKSVAVGASKNGELPDGFPADFPLYDPITVTAGMTTSSGSEKSFTVTAESTGPIEEIKSFYADELAAAGWEVKTTGNLTNGAGAYSVHGTKGEDTAGVEIVQSAPDSKVELMITLQMK